MDLRKMTQQELVSYQLYCQKSGNIQAVVECNDFIKYYNKVVTITKGKKNIGFTGVVFWLSRQHYSKSEWLGWVTRIGIKNSNNDVVFTSISNI